MNDYKWLEKKTPRSVDQLKLWSKNPRLNPETEYKTISAIAEEMTNDLNDKNHFLDLVESIALKGFIPADPIVVWQGENKKFYVAEGNRRVLALKLLREPNKAPKSIQRQVKRYAKKINLLSIEKIFVNVAPSFEESEWYISQRNSTSSLQTRWSRVQQLRWIESLYQQYEGDITRIINITSMSKSDLEGFIRILKIKDFVKMPSIKKLLTKEEFDNANSYKYPLTILERFINFTAVRDRWGISFNGIDVEISSNKKSFSRAFAELTKRIVNNEDNRINTRIVKEDIDEILDSFPNVTFEPDEEDEDLIGFNNSTNKNDAKNKNDEKPEDSDKKNESETIRNLKGNTNRNNLILQIYELDTENYRLFSLFNEFKKIPLNRYEHVVTSAVRVFLDLSVSEYIKKHDYISEISARYKSNIKDITLKQKLEYLKTHKFENKIELIVSKLLNSENQYSLDVLNGYIHNNDTHFSGKVFLNGFWDFLFPLFEELLEIREIDD